ncbi:MAG: hypothetical protein II874_02900 [Bacteroidales bacterium]|nr:hypothetical protein [Bacteroidales bacterium]
MKRHLLILAGLMAIVSCKGLSEVPFTKLDHYFFKSGQDIPANPKIDTEEEFTTLFGFASVMGESGQPTPVDWAREYVIAVVNPVTDQATELTPVSLSPKDGELVFTYNEAVGEKQSWTMQPVLLVKVDRIDEYETVRLVKRVAH